MSSHPPTRYECPYCGAHIGEGGRLPDHLPCDSVPTTEDVQEALR